MSLVDTYVHFSQFSKRPSSLSSRGMVPFQRAYLMICECARFPTAIVAHNRCHSLYDLHHLGWKSWLGESHVVLQSIYRSCLLPPPSLSCEYPA